MGEIIEFKARAKKLKTKPSTSSKGFKISSEVLNYLIAIISIILAGAFVFLCFTNSELALIIASLAMVLFVIIIWVLAIFRWY